MMPAMKRFVSFFALLLLIGIANPAFAQSILRDAESEALLADMSRDLIKAANLQPNNVRIILINDPSINAFVAGGQAVYIHSGLIDAASSANEVQGVIAHELGHVTGGHVPLGDRMAKGATGITILSLLLGAAAMAAGSADAGMGLMQMGQRAALGNFLAFSRAQEATTDAAGVKYLSGAGVSGRGMLDFFKKLQQQEYRWGLKRGGEQSYVMSHPMSGDRIATLTADLQADPAWSKPSDPSLEERFRRMQAKLRGYVSDPKDTLRRYPETDTTVPARYARAYAYHKSGYPQQAAAEAAALVKAEPHNPYFLELEGQILLESGKPKEAIPPLREATTRTNYQPLIATTFGHALLAVEDPALLPEAEKVLRQSVVRDKENPFAWYQLGMVYERKGDSTRAALATAERASMIGDMGRALTSAQAAMAGLPQGSPDWIRAQDIVMAAQAMMQDRKKR
ncbi:peptidase M48 [Sphingomonas koreensis]|jgi:predicted Zn-dependent protease|uniref:Peptidase M48 n=3 Tax=Sphingomonas koreensis TaxID=93064 RepID=A0A1L6J5V8_9SPHN|nr:M48 family metalloprotease [Sphingomonas koreensis]APR51227.1 peptidase M48 [Sphingomonas koreensis]